MIHIYNGGRSQECNYGKNHEDAEADNDLLSHTYLQRHNLVLYKK